MKPTVSYLESLVLTYANIPPTERMYCYTLRFETGIQLAACILERANSAKI